MSSPLEKIRGGVPVELARQLKIGKEDFREMFGKLSEGAQQMVLEAIKSLKEQAKKNPRDIIEALPAIMRFCGELTGNRTPKNTRLAYPIMSDASIAETPSEIPPETLAEMSARIEAFINEQEALLRGTKDALKQPPTIH